MKVLYIANEGKIETMSFYYSAYLACKALNYEFHIAYNAKDFSQEKKQWLYNNFLIVFHQIDFDRKPYSLHNLKAYRQLRDLCNKEKYDIIHCNTPIGGLLGRLVGSKCKVKKVIYQAHGFHFYKNAPLINWLIYYPIERYLAHKTDVLITINKEDFELAKKKMSLKKGGKIEYIPGVGIDVQSFSKNKKENLRIELNLTEENYVIISAGELNKNKNNIVVLKALNIINDSNIHYLICGVGPEEQNLRNYVNTNKLADRVHFLGYRKDIKELFSISNCFILSSYREGLSRSLMEAICSGLFCVVSKIRGNIDLVEEKYCFSPDDFLTLSEIIKNRGFQNYSEVLKNIDLDNIVNKLINVYVM